MRRNIGQDAMKLTASKVIMMMTSMIAAMLLSRFSTLEEYGTYSQLLIVINLGTTIFMLGLPNSINFFLAQTQDSSEKRLFLSTFYSMSTVLSAFTGLILVLCMPVITTYFHNPMLKSFLHIIIFLPWTRIIISSIENILIIYNKTNLLVFFRIINSIALLFILIIVYVLNLGFEFYLLLFIIIEVIFAIGVYLIANNISGGIWFSFNKILIRKILAFSVPIGLASVVSIINIELDKLLIGRYFSVKEIAIYTNAARELPITIIASSLTIVLMPLLVSLLKKNQNEAAIRVWGDSIVLSYIAICFFSLSIFVFAPEVITILYSDKFLDGVEVFRIYSIVLLLRVTFFGIILNSIGRTKLIFYSSIASLALNVFLNFLLYRALGFIGPAIATFIAITLVQIFQLIATSIALNIKFKDIFPWKKIGIITLINIAFGMVIFVIREIIPLEKYTGDILEAIILVLLWGGGYLLIMLKSIRLHWNSLNNK